MELANQLPALGKVRSPDFVHDLIRDLLFMQLVGPSCRSALTPGRRSNAALPDLWPRANWFKVANCDRFIATVGPAFTVLLSSLAGSVAASRQSAAIFLLPRALSPGRECGALPRRRYGNFPFIEPQCLRMATRRTRALSAGLWLRKTS